MMGVYGRPGAKNSIFMENDRVSENSDYQLNKFVQSNSPFSFIDRTILERNIQETQLCISKCGA